MRQLFISLCILASWAIGVAHAELHVLVPKEEEQNRAFSKIIDGIKSQSPSAEVTAIDDVQDAYEIVKHLQKPKIILGRRLLGVPYALPEHGNVVGGGFYERINTTSQIPTISLYPSIETIVDEVVKTRENISRIVTVTSKLSIITMLHAYSGSLAEGDVVLDVIESKSERETARRWFEILSDLDPENTAILISDEQYLESSGAYKAIVQTSWKRKILVVSALPKYARRGVSLSFIPELNAYGRHLAEIAEGKPFDENNYATPEFLKRVINRRTLEHNGSVVPGDLDELKHGDLIIQ